MFIKVKSPGSSGWLKLWHICYSYILTIASQKTKTKKNTKTLKGGKFSDEIFCKLTGV
jgi:hypothetical protein